MVFALKDRINGINRKGKNKGQIQEKLFNLTRIKYSTQPKNLSSLSGRVVIRDQFIYYLTFLQKQRALAYFALALISLSDVFMTRI